MVGELYRCSKVEHAVKNRTGLWDAIHNSDDVLDLVKVYENGSFLEEFSNVPCFEYQKSGYDHLSRFIFLESYQIYAELIEQIDNEWQIDIYPPEGEDRYRILNDEDISDMDIQYSSYEWTSCYPKVDYSSWFDSEHIVSSDSQYNSFHENELYVHLDYVNNNTGEKIPGTWNVYRCNEDYGGYWDFSKFNLVSNYSIVDLIRNTVGDSVSPISIESIRSILD